MIYGILSTLFFIIILPFWLIAGIFKPKLIAGFIEKCGFFKQEALKKINFNLPIVVFYGVSVGEIIAVENLIKKTREEFKQINIVVLTGTKTGQEIAHKKLSESCDFISYFPFDFPFCIKNFLKKLKPNAIFIMETELWPNFANITAKEQIPTYIINARISDNTFKSYKKLSFFFKPILNKYRGIFPQSKNDCEKLVSIGANPNTTRIMGNLKFDIKKPEIDSLSFSKNPQDKVIIAGSTHFGEDEIILEIFKELKTKINGLKLIIAPRHPERNENVFNLIKKYELTCQKRSQNGDLLNSDVLLLDTMGELGKFYSVCDVAFIGGSFNKTGGHNPLEATIFSKPVVSGLSVHNFKDIYAILTRTDAGFVGDIQEVQARLEKLLSDDIFYKKACQDCETVFDENKGALQFVIEVLKTVV